MSTCKRCGKGTYEDYGYFVVKCSNCNHMIDIEKQNDQFVYGGSGTDPDSMKNYSSKNKKYIKNNKKGGRNTMSGYRGSSGVTYGRSWWSAKNKCRQRYAYVGKKKVGVIGTRGGGQFGRRKVIFMKRF